MVSFKKTVQEARADLTMGSKLIFHKDIAKILDEEAQEEDAAEIDIEESENTRIHAKLGTPSPTGSNKSFIPDSEMEESESEDENKKLTWKSKVKRKNEQNSDIKVPNKIQKNSTSLDRDFFGHPPSSSLKCKTVNPSSVFVNEQSSESDESDPIPDIDPIQKISPFKFPAPVHAITGKRTPVSENVVDKPSTTSMESVQEADIFESDDGMVEEVPTPSKNMKKSFTIEFKLKCVQEVTTSSIGAVG